MTLEEFEKLPLAQSVELNPGDILVEFDVRGHGELDSYFLLGNHSHGNRSRWRCMYSSSRDHEEAESKDGDILDLSELALVEDITRVIKCAN